jgi:hypothetical protein
MSEVVKVWSPEEGQIVSLEWTAPTRSPLVPHNCPKQCQETQQLRPQPCVDRCPDDLVLRLTPCMAHLRKFQTNAAEIFYRTSQWTDVEVARFAQAIVRRANYRPDHGALLEDTAAWRWAVNGQDLRWMSEVERHSQYASALWLINQEHSPALGKEQESIQRVKENQSRAGSDE